MNRYIVTTTIHSPTEALRLFAQKIGWTLLIVGDLKTPHEEYRSFDCIYLDPAEQEARYPELSRAIGWNTIQRRNIGLLDACRRGADIVATVDDDNIPYSHWGEDLLVGRTVHCDLYSSKAGVFDPLSVTNASHLWHRGYPLNALEERRCIEHHGPAERKVLVQADLWDGDPDIDALVRIVLRPEVTLEVARPFSSDQLCPFNSQNTFLAREVLPYYAMLPDIGRAEDIWAAFVLQRKFPGCVAFNRPSVRQLRNPHDLVSDLEQELFGYRHTPAFVACNADLAAPFVPERARKVYELYCSLAG